jgi:purine nucleosidase
LTHGWFSRKVQQQGVARVRDFDEVWFQKRPAVTFHDPLAAACVFEPGPCQYRLGEVTVSLNEPTLGWTVFRTQSDDPPHTVASEVDSARVFEHYFGVVK